MIIHAKTRREYLENLAVAFKAAAERCPTGKIGHKKRREAQSVATRLNKREVLDGPNMQAVAYRCWHCSQWHVGRPKHKLREGA